MTHGNETISHLKNDASGSLSSRRAAPMSCGALRPAPLCPTPLPRYLAQRPGALLAIHLQGAPFPFHFLYTYSECGHSVDFPIPGPYLVSLAFSGVLPGAPSPSWLHLSLPPLPLLVFAFALPSLCHSRWPKSCCRKVRHVVVYSCRCSFLSSGQPPSVALSSFSPLFHLLP
jgi:hypothetical protein